MAVTDSRPLTSGERELAASMFGRELDCDPVRIHRRKFIFFQPRKVLMAPNGHIWVHPESSLWREDYSQAPVGLQGLFLHEMTHVLQAQQRGRYYLLLMRHPFCRYRYDFRPGWSFERYGLEQQAEIVRHVFLQRQGWSLAGAAPLASLERVLPFASA